VGIPVQVSDVHTKEVVIYSSKWEAGLALGVSDSTIGRYIKSKKLLLNKFSIITIII
jgi:hypothetical protein